MLRLLIIAAFALVGAQTADAAAREMSGTELRDAVASGRTMGLGDLLARVPSAATGDLVDARAFEDGQVYVRLLIKRSDGKLVAVLFDGRSGRVMSPRSDVAASILEDIDSNRRGRSASAPGRSGGAPGRGGSETRDRGGSDRGNSGGGDRGNSGGGDRGNSGGNGRN